MKVTFELTLNEDSARLLLEDANEQQCTIGELIMGSLMVGTHEMNPQLLTTQVTIDEITVLEEFNVVWDNDKEDNIVVRKGWHSEIPDDFPTLAG